MVDGLVARRRMGTLVAAALLASICPCAAQEPARTAPPVKADSVSLRIAVMDPLSAQLACDCVAGYARREYGKLGKFLEKRLGRAVEIAYAEVLTSPSVRAERGVDLIVGKFSVVVADARQASLRVRPIAMLSGNDGSGSAGHIYYVSRDYITGEWSPAELVTGPHSASQGSIDITDDGTVYVANAGLDDVFFSGDLFIAAQALRQ